MKKSVQKFTQKTGLDAAISRRRLLGNGATLASGLWVAGQGLPALAQDRRFAETSRAVSTRSGRVQGLQYANGVEAFYGVPYGASTAADARFQAPRQEQAWRGVREAFMVGNRSPQGAGAPVPEVDALDRKEPLGEDCLNLNVFTPGSRRGSRPVMVWLHGGGYTSGSGGWLLYDGTQLAASEDVVVVTVSHRLNVFGYLYLAELAGDRYEASGNAGMLDIIAALEWVRDNISAFGGDPDNVTIFGQSGGGGKVSTLMAMPAAHGLFHKAIAMSGFNLQGISRDEASETAERYLSSLGIKAEQMDHLHERSMEELLTAFLQTPGLNLGPVVDGEYLPTGPFDGEAPDISADVPMLLGSTEHEVNFLPPTPLDPISEKEMMQRLYGTLQVEASEIPKLVDVYRDNRPDVSDVELYQIIASDHTFRRGVIAEAELKARQSQQGGAPAWVYYFRWQSPIRNGKLRAYHCLDIPFAFNNVDVCAAMTGSGQERYSLAAALSGGFAAFARNGDPNHEGIPQWTAFDTQDRSMLVLDDKLSVEQNLFLEQQQALYSIT